MRTKQGYYMSSWTIPVADPGKGAGGPGAPIIFDQAEARRAEKSFWDPPPLPPPPSPRYLKVWIRRCIQSV